MVTITGDTVAALNYRIVALESARDAISAEIANLTAERDDQLNRLAYGATKD